MLLPVIKKHMINNTLSSHLPKARGYAVVETSQI